MSARALDPEPVTLSAALLAVLACPACHCDVAVDHDRGEVVCVGRACGLAYPVRGGVPVMLVDEARATRTDAA